MSIFGKFEKKVESAVNGVFARAFKGDVQPVEIAARLQRELDAEAKLMSRDKRLVPNDFTVGLSEHDYAKLTPYSKTLIAELAGELKSHARDTGYMFNGPIRIHFEQDSSLPTGRFTVASQAVAGVSTDRPSARPSARSSSPSAASGPGGSPPAAWSGPAGGSGLSASGPSAASSPSAYSGPSAASGSSAFSAASAHSASPEPSAASGPDNLYRPTQSRSQLVLEVNGLRHPLTPPGFVIGRGTDADLRINDPGVSRLHAEIKVRTTSNGDEAEILDLGSTNGITVNGHKVQHAVLADGTRIEIGSTRMLVHAPAGR